MIPEIAVLDKGFVRIVDLMGSDQRVVQTARVSYAQGSKGEEKDAGLIQYLMKNDHGTPFESVVFTFHIKCPLFIHAQFRTYRMSSASSQSHRYTEVIVDEFHKPHTFRAQSTKNKQGSEISPEVDQIDAQIQYEGAMRAAFIHYQKLLELGVCREQARCVLPSATYTQFYWIINARSLMNFLRQRLDSHAQWEMQEYARAVWTYFHQAAPVTAQAFANRHPALGLYPTVV